MTSIEINKTNIVINVIGVDKFLSLKNQLVINRSNIIEVKSAEDKAKKWFLGLKISGTHIPGVVSAGTFYNFEGMTFWDVHNASNSISLILRNEFYSEIIIEVENPLLIIDKLNNIINN